MVYGRALGSAGLKVGLDLRCLFQPKQFHDLEGGRLRERREAMCQNQIINFPK